MESGWGLDEEPGRGGRGWPRRVLGPSQHLLSPCPLGLAAWEEYPTLKMLMEMVMTKYVGTHAARTGHPARAGLLAAPASQPGCLLGPAAAAESESAMPHPLPLAVGGR